MKYTNMEYLLFQVNKDKIYKAVSLILAKMNCVNRNSIFLI